MVGVVSAPRASSHLALEASPDQGEQDWCGGSEPDRSIHGEHENMAGVLTGSGLRISQGTADLEGGALWPFAYFLGVLITVLSRDRLLLQGCWLHPGRAAGP